MDGELIGLIIAGITALGTAGAGAITAWNRAPADNITTLTERVNRLDGQVNHLLRWQLAARGYIFELLGTLAANGIKPPEAPEELELKH